MEAVFSTPHSCLTVELLFVYSREFRPVSELMEEDIYQNNNRLIAQDLVPEQ